MGVCVGGGFSGAATAGDFGGKVRSTRQAYSVYSAQLAYPALPVEDEMRLRWLYFDTWHCNSGFSSFTYHFYASPVVATGSRLRSLWQIST